MSTCSVIIVTYQRKELLIKCLDSLRGNEVKPTEIIVGLNGLDVDTSLLLEKYNEVKVFIFDQGTPGEIRNNAMGKAIGDFIVFLDDDVILPSNYIQTGMRIIDDYPELDIFGGPDSTPPDGTYSERALGVALMSPLATARTRMRHSPGEKNQRVDSSEEEHILCNLWVKRNILISGEIEFDSRFFRNEENVLLQQLKQQNRKFGYFATLFLFHKRRATLKGVVRAVFSSGKHRMRQFIYFPHMFSFQYLIPAIFVLYLCSALIIQRDYCWYPLYFYFFLSTVTTIVLIKIKEKSPLLIPKTLFFQILINICYGLGTVYELITRPILGFYGMVRTSKKDERET